MSAITVPAEGRQTSPLDSADVLVGTDGNAFSIMGATSKALRRAGATAEYIDAYRTEAMTGDYDHVIATSIAYLDAEAE